MELEFGAATDIGRKRAHNEDNYLIDKDLRLFVVADGMGGHSAGEVASAITVHTIHEIVAEAHDLLKNPESSDPTHHIEVLMVLEHAVHVACSRVYDKASNEPEKKGMGTTVVCLLLTPKRGYIAYVGDSRIYLKRGELIYQLTEDHSVLNELARQGKQLDPTITRSRLKKIQNAMTRAVGPHPTVDVDTADFDLAAGDSFLLCSDGLYEYLDDADIGRSLALPDLLEIPGMLVQLANERGGKDNITGLVVRVPAGPSSPNSNRNVAYTLDTLRNVSLFQDLSSQELLRVMNLAHLDRRSAGSYLFKEGDPGQELFVLLRGEVQISKGDTALVTLEPGSYFGELALVDKAKRSASAYVSEDCQVLTIGHDAFHEIVQHEPLLSNKILWRLLTMIARRLRNTTQELSKIQPLVAEQVEDLSDELLDG